MNSVSYKGHLSDVYSYNDLLKQYIEEKFQEVHYELILDSLYMQKVKDEDWKEKMKIAQTLYDESKELVTFLRHLLDKENMKKEG